MFRIACRERFVNYAYNNRSHLLVVLVQHTNKGSRLGNVLLRQDGRQIDHPAYPWTVGEDTSVVSRVDGSQ
ncbi:hypothetical protein CBM2622_A210225 [Cupriavidus taiwanensis]|nr:hypothetical protein CBM2622_A210225 [Cupriavidus taiwanensis]